MLRLSDIPGDESGRRALSAALAATLPRQRWFARKGEASLSVEISDAVLLRDQGSEGAFALLFVEVAGESASDQSDCYVVPVATRASVGERTADALLIEADGALVECSSDPKFWQGLLLQSRVAPLQSLHGGVLSFSNLSEPEATGGFDLSRIGVSSAEQSNTAVTLGDWGFLKLFRRVEAGVNPDVEIGRFLTETAPTVNTPKVLGTLDYQPAADRDSISIAILLERVAGEVDAWQFTLSSLAGFWQRVAESAADWPAGRIEAEAAASSLARLIGPYLDAVGLLGRRTAEMHVALAAGMDEAFRPEPLTAASIAALHDRVAVELTATCRLLRSSSVARNSAQLADRLQNCGSARLDDVARKLAGLQNVSAIRVHGDYHLGQVLRTRDDFVIIDFEGEPDRSLAERREKRCALKDVAGMIRSLHYASNAASVGLLPAPVPSIAAPQAWQRQWFVACRSAFLGGYFDSLRVAGVIPNDQAATGLLLDLFVVEKALYELRYEINHRPDWVAIPLAGLSELFQIDV
jgi:trehalose synthase-fused probable maltokinase